MTTTTTTTMNIYQAALQLRSDYGHLDGVETECTTNPDANLYFIFHDALHTYTGALPQESDEPLVLATELVLGGQEYSHVAYLSTVTPDQVSTALAGINPDMIEHMIDFYTAYYSH